MTGGNTAQRDYDPLDRTTFDAIAYNAVGRASEINTYPALSLTHSSGNSGWSVGIVQWDFGQPGRGDKVYELMSGYQAWASPEQRFSTVQVEDLTRRLQMRGQVGNALTGEEQSRLNAYLRSDAGRELVSSLNREQIDKKWEHVGQPLSRIEWLRDLRQTDPAQATEIVAQTMKLYNQNEIRGARLINHLQNNEVSSAQTRDWIGTHGIDGLNPDARRSIISGRDNAIAGAQLMNSLELGDGRLAQAWRREVHDKGNTSLYEGFNGNPDVQLLDAMMRSPTAGRALFDHVDNGEPARDVTIRAARPNAALEMSRVELNRAGELRLVSPQAETFEMSRDGWKRNGIPLPDAQHDRPPAAPVHLDDLGSHSHSPRNDERHDKTKAPHQPSSLMDQIFDRMHQAASNKDDRAMDASLKEYEQSPYGQQFLREIDALDKAWQAEEKAAALQGKAAGQQQQIEQTHASRSELQLSR